MKSQTKLIIGMIAMIAGCSSHPISSDTKQLVSSQLPEGDFKLRKFEEINLENGLRILWIPDDSLPRVSLQLMVMTGSINDPAGKVGINALTASLLDQGTAKRSATQIADQLGQIGTEISQGPSHDFTSISTSSLTSEKKKLLDIFADIMMNPAFSPKEIERVRSHFIAAIQKQVDNPTHFADLKVDEVIYKNHPYAFPVNGEVESIKSITRNDIMRQYFKHYRPNNSILAVVGQIDETYLKQVKTVFSRWQRQDVLPPPAIDLADAARTNLKLFAKAELKQTQIRLASLGIERKNPDFLLLRLANMTFGGSFASRLNQKIRDDLGLTYSISSSSDTRLQRGVLEISTFTRHEKTKEVIVETLKLLEQFSKEGITQKELDAAKALLIGQFPSAIETVDRLAFNLMVLRRYEIPDSYLSQFIATIKGIELSQVNEAVRKHYKPENYQIIVYSDPQFVMDQMNHLGKVDLIPVQ